MNIKKAVVENILKKLWNIRAELYREINRNKRDMANLVIKQKVMKRETTAMTKLIRDVEGKSNNDTQ